MYEAFDDNIACDQDGHLTDRYIIGFTYTLFEKDIFAASLMGEYRISSYEKAAGSTAEDKLNEAFSRLVIELQAKSLKSFTRYLWQEGGLQKPSQTLTISSELDSVYSKLIVKNPPSAFQSEGFSQQLFSTINHETSSEWTSSVCGLFAICIPRCVLSTPPRFP